MEVNSRKVEFLSGETILDVVRRNGYYIPTLCNLRGVHPGGHCRICLVEINDGEVTTSCNYPAREDLKVFTETPKLNNLRKGILELLWQEHEIQCLTCLKEPLCELIDRGREVGVDFSSYYKVAPLVEGKIRIWPHSLVYERGKCILCGRCVFACALTEAKALYLDSLSKEIGIVKELCTGCGFCVQVCPAKGLSPLSHIPQVKALEEVNILYYPEPLLEALGERNWSLILEALMPREIKGYLTSYLLDLLEKTRQGQEVDPFQLVKDNTPQSVIITTCLKSKQDRLTLHPFEVLAFLGRREDIFIDDLKILNWEEELSRLFEMKTGGEVRYKDKHFILPQGEKIIVTAFLEPQEESKQPYFILGFTEFSLLKGGLLWN